MLHRQSLSVPLAVCGTAILPTDVAPSLTPAAWPGTGLFSQAFGLEVPSNPNYTVPVTVYN